MRLTELQPRFLRYETRIEERECHRADGYMDDPNHVHSDACWEKRTGPCVYYPRAATIAEAQGIMFLCPACGTESVLCYFNDRGVPPEALPGPGRWNVTGTGFEDLSLSPSVNVDNEHWHGFITNGEVTP